MDPVKIVIYADYIWPFCYIGKGIVERLKQEFSIIEEWLPFEIHPDTPPEGARWKDYFPGTGADAGQDALQLLGFDSYGAYKIRRLFRKKNKETMPELYRIHRQDEDQYISIYQQHNANLAELMTRDREIDMAELDKAWTAGNPETWLNYQIRNP